MTTSRPSRVLFIVAGLLAWSSCFTVRAQREDEAVSNALTAVDIIRLGDPDDDMIVGEAGNDYPTYAEVPNTAFSCRQQGSPGYYADQETQCQVFHICVTQGRRLEQFSFLCPNGTIFNQQYLVCVWWYEFDCTQAPSLYSINANIFGDAGAAPSSLPASFPDDTRGTAAASAPRGQPASRFPVPSQGSGLQNNLPGAGARADAATQLPTSPRGQSTEGRGSPLADKQGATVGRPNLASVAGDAAGRPATAGRPGIAAADPNSAGRPDATREILSIEGRPSTTRGFPTSGTGSGRPITSISAGGPGTTGAFPNAADGSSVGGGSSSFGASRPGFTESFATSGDRPGTSQGFGTQGSGLDTAGGFTDSARGPTTSGLLTGVSNRPGTPGRFTDAVDGPGATRGSIVSAGTPTGGFSGSAGVPSTAGGFSGLTGVPSTAGGFSSSANVPSTSGGFSGSARVPGATGGFRGSTGTSGSKLGFTGSAGGPGTTEIITDSSGRPVAQRPGFGTTIGRPGTTGISDGQPGSTGNPGSASGPGTTEYSNQKENFPTSVRNPGLSSGLPSSVTSFSGSPGTSGEGFGGSTSRLPGGEIGSTTGQFTSTGGNGDFASGALSNGGDGSIASQTPGSRYSNTERFPGSTTGFTEGLDSNSGIISSPGSDRQSGINQNIIGQDGQLQGTFTQGGTGIGGTGDLLNQGQSVSQQGQSGSGYRQGQNVPDQGQTGLTQTVPTGLDQNSIDVIQNQIQSGQEPAGVDQGYTRQFQGQDGLTQGPSEGLVGLSQGQTNFDKTQGQLQSGVGQNGLISGQAGVGQGLTELKQSQEGFVSAQGLGTNGFVQNNNPSGQISQNIGQNIRFNPDDSRLSTLPIQSQGNEGYSYPAPATSLTLGLGVSSGSGVNNVEQENLVFTTQNQEFQVPTQNINNLNNNIQTPESNAFQSTGSIISNNANALNTQVSVSTQPIQDNIDYQRPQLTGNSFINNDNEVREVFVISGDSSSSTQLQPNQNQFVSNTGSGDSGGPKLAQQYTYSDPSSNNVGGSNSFIGNTNAVQNQPTNNVSPGQLSNTAGTSFISNPSIVSQPQHNQNQFVSNTGSGDSGGPKLAQQYTYSNPSSNNVGGSNSFIGNTNAVQNQPTNNVSPGQLSNSAGTSFISNPSIVSQPQHNQNQFVSNTGSGDSGGPQLTQQFTYSNPSSNNVGGSNSFIGNTNADQNQFTNNVSPGQLSNAAGTSFTKNPFIVSGNTGQGGTSISYESSTPEQNFNSGVTFSNTETKALPDISNVVSVNTFQANSNLGGSGVTTSNNAGLNTPVDINQQLQYSLPSKEFSSPGTSFQGNTPAIVQQPQNQFVSNLPSTSPVSLTNSLKQEVVAPVTQAEPVFIFQTPQNSVSTVDLAVLQQGYLPPTNDVSRGTGSTSISLSDFSSSFSFPSSSSPSFSFPSSSSSSSVSSNQGTSQSSSAGSTSIISSSGSQTSNQAVGTSFTGLSSVSSFPSSFVGSSSPSSQASSSTGSQILSSSLPLSPTASVSNSNSGVNSVQNPSQSFNLGYLPPVTDFKRNIRHIGRGERKIFVTPLPKEDQAQSASHQQQFTARKGSFRPSLQIRGEDNPSEFVPASPSKSFGKIFFPSNRRSDGLPTTYIDNTRRSFVASSGSPFNPYNKYSLSWRS